ncbi:hypothetical protein [Burkholderia territorii]|uniref:hypothetical protein n=1 Tax=Burkholderia territorii TaxID=1503055 RepID=UPI0039BF622B
MVVKSYSNGGVASSALLDTVRRALSPERVMMNMAFNMQGKLLAFRKFLAATQPGDWNAAAAEMLDSLWARQIGDRAKRLASMMRSGA